MPKLLIDNTLETTYIVAGLTADETATDFEIHGKLSAADIGPDDFALVQTPEIALLTATHLVDPIVGIFTAEAGAIVMRTFVRPDEIEDASILLYETGSTAELLARATIWPFYGIKANAWSTEPDGSSAITIVDGLAALEPAEAGFNEDLVRAWYILTDQPVVTHLLVVPVDATEDEVDTVRTRVNEAVAVGYTARREIRKALLAESTIDSERLVEFLARLRFELDSTARAAAYSLLARGSGGTRFPLIREIPWRLPASD